MTPRTVAVALALVPLLAAAPSLAAGGDGPARKSVPLPQQADFSGSWDTTYGVMELRQEGQQVTGTYTHGGGSTVTGTVRDRSLIVRYEEPDKTTGSATFTMTPDGERFVGSWTADGTSTDAPWAGVRSDAPSAADAASKRCAAQKRGAVQARDFAGRWATTYGPMTLAKRGTRHLDGTYGAGGGSAVSGRIASGCFVFRYRERDATGQGWFALDASGKAFAGEWTPEGSAQWGAWQGTRPGQGGTAAAEQRCRATKLDAEPGARFSGVWKTSFGEMTLKQTGTKVEGTYDYQGGSQVKGRVVGRCLVLRYDEPGASGQAVFFADPLGNSFAGEWRQDGTAQWSSWTGDRKDGRTL